jgi:hypothetical protein
MNTNLHVTERQARDLLRCVRYSTMLRDAYEHVDARHSLPTDAEMRGLESMLLAALERIRDLEYRRSHT